jgi:hypothetical protein
VLWRILILASNKISIKKLPTGSNFLWKNISTYMNQIELNHNNQIRNQETLRQESFTIKVEQRLSLAEMIEIQTSGNIIERSAHVGNQYLSNLVIAASKIRLNLFDRTLPLKDKNYHPGFRIEDEVKTELIDETQVEVLVRDIQTNSDEELYSYHSNALKSAFPDVDLIKYSDYLWERREIIEQAINGLEFDPTMWTRYKTIDGRIENRSPKTKNELIKNILDVTSQDEGYIFKVELNALIISIADYIKYNQGLDPKDPKYGKVYHISGPDMIKYLPTKSNQDILAMLYQQVKSNSSDLSSKLPDSLEFILLPSYHLRLAVPKQYKSLLDSMIQTMADLNTLGATKGEAMKSFVGDQNQKRAFIDGFTQQQKKYEEIINHVLKVIGPTIFPYLSAAKHITQYDFSSPKDIYIPDYLLHTPANIVEDKLKVLRKIYITNQAKQIKNNQ